MTPIRRSRFVVRGRQLSLATVVTLLFLIGSAGSAISEDGNPALSNVPKAFVGTWKVESVLVDLGSSRTLLYQRDDPRLIGKQFTISDLKIESNTPEARECLMPGAALWKTTARSLLALTLAPHGIPGSRPTVNDYELPLAPDAQVDAWSVKCNPGRFGPYPLNTAWGALSAKDLGTWIVALPTGHLALRWYDQTILILTRAP